MPKPLTHRDIAKRLTNAHRETFTDWGCIALESVIKGRVGHLEAVYALEMLRDLILDRGGDLMTSSRMRSYAKRIGVPMDQIDLTYYRDEYSNGN